MAEITATDLMAYMVVQRLDQIDRQLGEIKLALVSGDRKTISVRSLIGKLKSFLTQNMINWLITMTVIPYILRGGDPFKLIELLLKFSG